MPLPKIKDLRSRVQLIAKVETVPTTGPFPRATLVTYVPIATVYGDLKPSRPHLFIGESQLDINVSERTHRLIIRWYDSIDIFDTVIRDTYKPDGTIRRENFRVLGVNDMDNQRRFLWVDLQLRTSADYPYSFTVSEAGNASDGLGNSTVAHTASVHESGNASDAADSAANYAEG